MGLFFMGSSSQLEEIQAKEQKRTGAIQKQKEQPKQVKTAKDIPPISEAHLKILKRTLVMNKSEVLEIYVKQGIEEIDRFYHYTGENQIDPDLYMEARKIKRLYKNYPDYLWAVDVYNDYMYALMDKYGSKESLRIKLNCGMVEDWIPPTPIYSANSPDYDLSSHGMLPFSLYEDDYFEVDQDIMNQIIEEGSVDIDEVEDIEIESNLVTDLYTYKQLDGHSSTVSSSGSTMAQNGRVNVSDLVQLQNMFKQNIVGDTNIKEKEEFEYLSKDPEIMKRNYYLSKPLSLKPGEAEKIMNGYDEDEEDLDAMVRDNVSRKYMSLRELRTREVYRTMTSEGWSELKLLQRSGTASKYELESLKKKGKNKKKRNQAAGQTIAGLMGDAGIEVFGSVDEMQNFLFRD